MIRELELKLADAENRDAMLRDSGISGRGYRPTRWRWLGAGVCLLFALSVLLHLGYLSSAHADASGATVVGISGSSDHGAPKGGHNIAQECEASAHCSFAGPPRSNAAVVDGAANVGRPAAADSGPIRTVRPEYRPPKLPI